MSNVPPETAGGGAWFDCGSCRGTVGIEPVLVRGSSGRGGVTADPDDKVAWTEYDGSLARPVVWKSGDLLANNITCIFRVQHDFCQPSEAAADGCCRLWIQSIAKLLGYKGTTHYTYIDVIVQQAKDRVYRW